MNRPFIIIPRRSYRPETQSAIAAMRIKTDADEVKAKEIKRLIKKATKLGLSGEAINALRAEYDPYFYLHMTQEELWTLKCKLSEVGLGTIDANISGYGMNFIGSQQYMIRVADPVVALQSALDSIKETILFRGVVEIEYQDSQEIKFLKVRESVVTMVDEYPR